MAVHALVARYGHLGQSCSVRGSMQYSNVQTAIFFRNRVALVQTEGHGPKGKFKPSSSTKIIIIVAINLVSIKACGQAMD